MRYLATILGIMLLCGQAAAQEPVPTLQMPTPAIVAHPYIKPMLTEAKPVVITLEVPLAPLPLADFDKAAQPVHKVFPEQVDKPFLALSLLYMAGTAADIITTKKAIARGGIESNQLFARNSGKDIALALNITASTIPLVVAYILQRLGAKWPARVLLSVAAGFRWNAAIHNHNLLRN